MERTDLSGAFAYMDAVTALLDDIRFSDIGGHQPSREKGVWLPD